jgi:uncharacterized protein (DUF1330 family)
VIADVEVLDPEHYKEYSRHVPDSLRPYGGRFLVRGGATEVLEGSREPQRVVILEFPSTEKAREWYTSPQYQEILPIRQASSKSSLILVEGVAG